MLSFFDMERVTGLRLFEALLVVVMAAFALASVVIPVGLLAGRGDVVVPAVVDRPYGVTFPGGRSIDVLADGAVVRRQFGVGATKYVEAPPKVSVRASVEHDDVNARVALALTTLATFAVVWVGLVSLWLVVRSAKAADPFVAANVRRLRTVAAAVLALPFVARFGTWFVDGALDSDVDLRVTAGGPTFQTCLVVGLGLLALAHVFREGVALRELEKGTV
jgi:hypothetical protein